MIEPEPITAPFKMIEPMPIRQRASIAASVEDGVVADRDVVADIDAILFFHAVERAAVLNIGIVPDANLVHVAAQHGVHPDAGVLAENHVADDLGRVVDVAGVGNLGSDAFM